MAKEGLLFDQCHQVGYINCKDLIWVLYPTIDHCRLPPSSITVNMFIMELVMNPSPSLEEGFNTPHQGVPLPWGDPLESFEVVRDPSSITRGPIDPKNDES